MTKLKETNIKAIWHINLRITNGNFKCSLSENPSGCGQMILHDWAFNTNVKDSKEGLKYLLNIIQNKNGMIPGIPYRKLDVGSIITTIGQDHYKKPIVKVLRNLGFKSINVYTNPRHDNEYMQRLYIWKKK
jgi:hypothetical protein